MIFARKTHSRRVRKPFVIQDVNEWLMDLAESGPCALAAYAALTIILRQRPQNFKMQ